MFGIYHYIDLFVQEITRVKKDDKALVILDDVKVAKFEDLVDTEGKKRRMVLINYLFLSAIKFELTFKLDIDDLNLKYVPPLINKIVLSLGDSLASLVQVYKIMGNSDLLCNPVKLVDNIGTGFVELFNEPRKGFLQGPDKYGSGLQKGVNSLLANVVGSNKSVVSVTGTLMTTKKSVRKKKKTEENANEEQKKATEDIGFQGVIENPYKNTKINGVQGFIKGLGSGFFGAILTPLAEMFTFNTNANRGMKNTAIKFAGGKIKTSNMIEEPMMVKVREVSSCEVYIENNMYSVTFIMTSGRRRGFKLYEQKVACRLYDLFKQITAGNIPIDKSNAIYENEF